MEPKNPCQTLLRYEPNGQPVFKPKQKFETLDDAIKECKLLNAMPHRIHKIVSYKCTVCHKYHVGRNGKEITSKLKEKLIKESHTPTKEELDKRRNRNQKIAFEFADFKVVGKIDLTKIPKK